MTEHDNWNLTIIAVVALVSVVGLVALAMNAGKAPAKEAASAISAFPTDEQNIAGNARCKIVRSQDTKGNPCSCIDCGNGCSCRWEPSCTDATCY